MMNRPIEGRIENARVIRLGFGMAFVTALAIRETGGRLVTIGRAVASTRLTDALEPGSEGRFYFHDIMGLQGIHAFAARGEATRIAFPMVAERISAALIVLALSVVASAIILGGALQMVPVALVFAGTAGWAVFRASRQAILHDLAFETRMGVGGGYVPAMARY